MFERLTLNYLALVVVVLVNMLVGALWYSPLLFGNIWLRLIGKKAEEISKEDANKSMSFAIIPALVSAVGLALLVEIASATTIFDALILGTLSSVFFSGMSMLNLVFFEDRSLKLTVLNAGYSFASWNIGAVILTLWK